MLTDAQSSGFVSRLVKYYDQSQNDPTEKSRIVYNKVGDFPLVQLKKNEIKRSISKATSVRIAPPNRTVLNRDVRAAIMRSNSFQFTSGIPKVQPVKMRAKDDSHQIITNHEPLNEETYPVSSSNSVLDALEKNCRKRINNEELILDRTKKFCPPAFEQPSSSTVTQINTNNTPQSAKRTREPSSPNKKFPSFDFQQKAKKLRTKNNALLSSLSSSHHELIPSTPPSSPQINKTKPIPKTLLNKSPVIVQEKEKTPVEEQKKRNVEKEVTDAPIEQTKAVEQPKKLQLFNRKPDPNAISNRAKFRLYDSDDEEEVHIKFVKPKEQVIEGNDDRKELEKAKLAKMLESLTKGTEPPFKPKEKPKDTVDAPKNESKTTQSASISFSTSTTTAVVAPLSSSGNTLVTSTNVKDILTSSSGFQLSSGINLSKPDEKNEKKTVVPSIQLPDMKLPTGTSAPSITSLSSVVTSSESEKPKISTESALTPAGGIKFSFGTSAKSQEPTITPSNNEKSSIAPVPSLGGFQFGKISSTPSSQPMSTLTVSTSLPQSNKPVSPLALFSTSASAVTTQSMGISNKIDTITTTASGIGFSFGGMKPAISGVTPISSSNPAPVSFNFGAKPTEVTTAPPTFNFGKSTSVTTTAQQNSSQIENKSTFSFGGNSIAPVQSFSKSEAPKNTFSFGTSSQAASSTPVTPIFGQSNPSSSTAVTTASSGFNFGSSNVVATASSTFGQLNSNNAGSTNTFGQISSTPSFTSLNATPSTAPPTFGTFNTPTTTSNSIFGTALTNSQQSSSVFGGFNANTNNQSSSSPFTASTQQLQQQTPFGQAEAPKSTFSFGQSSNTPAGSDSSIFGSSQPSAKPSFNFGSNTSSQSTFGGINTAPSQEAKPAFNFSSSSTTTFGSQQPNAASAPVFGSTSFNFNKPQETPSPFGSIQSQPSGDKPAFNFNQATPQLPQMSTSFNIGTAGQQQRKPFRTATRRLK